MKLKLPQPKKDIRNHQPFVERDIAIDANVESKIKKVTEAVSSGVNADAILGSVIASGDTEESMAEGMQEKEAPNTKAKTEKSNEFISSRFSTIMSFRARGALNDIIQQD